MTERDRRAYLRRAPAQAPAPPAARLLGIDRTTLQRMIKRHGLDAAGPNNSTDTNGRPHA